MNLDILIWVKCRNTVDHVIIYIMTGIERVWHSSHLMFKKYSGSRDLNQTIISNMGKWSKKELFKCNREERLELHKTEMSSDDKWIQIIYPDEKK